MDDNEPKTEEAPASLWPGVIEAQQVTSTDKNKAKPNKYPGRVASGKKLAYYNRRVREKKKKKGGSKQSEDPKDPGLEGAGTTGVGLQPEPETSSSFSLTQILSLAGIVLSLAGLHCKRKELMVVFDKPKPKRQAQPT